MAYPIIVREKARRLRLQGYSVKEIAELLDIAVGTSSIWIRQVVLNRQAKDRLKIRGVFGRYKAAQRWQEKREKRRQEIEKETTSILKEIILSTEIKKLLCAFLYWGEGAKDPGRIAFTNSDPTMVSIFLMLFRESFKVEEKKFRILIHLHEYHDEGKIKKFWSDVTRIPFSQFTKSYQKQHTKKRKRVGYRGTIRVTYHDTRVASELIALYNMFAKSLGA
ncbi:MAG: hypothetical protein Q8R11_01595 [bacterium]|nr:hypothetical protein [bacterium]